MKTTFTLGAVAVLSLVAVQAALAQDTSSQLSSVMSSASSEPSSAMSEAVTAPGDVNYGQIISALEAGKMADLSTVTDSSIIDFVLVSDLKANGDATALENAIENNPDAATLQSNVDTNATLSAKLDGAGYTHDQVVAVIANDDASFTIVINDQHP